MNDEQTPDMPPELAADLATELSDDARFLASPSTSPSHTPTLGPGGSLPIDDLSRRVKLLADAWVEIYEDGPLRIKFDIEGRRQHAQKTEGIPTHDGPLW